MFDVAVVGAGVAGMVATRKCIEAGFSVRLLEAKARPGGRLHAVSDGGEGSLELGGQFFHVDSSPLLAAELERYGVRAGAAMSCRNQLVLLDGQLHDLSQVFRHDPAHLRTLVTTIGALTAALSDPTERASLERVSASDGLAALSLPPVIATWFRSWVEQYAGTSLSNISVANMLGLVEAGRGSLRAASHVSGEWLLPDTRALTDSIWHDVAGSAQLESEVLRIATRTPDDGYQLVLAHETIEARAVIIAAPRNVLAAEDGLAIELDWRGAPPAALREAQPGLGYKSWALLDSSAPAATTVLGELGGFRLLAVGEREADGTAWAVLFGSATTFERGSAAESVDIELETRRAVSFAWGDTVRVLEVRSQDWVADPFARGAWTVAPVQDTDPLEELHARTPAAVAFAGADFSSRRGGVESALRSGIEAAERTITHLAPEGATHA